MDSKVFDPEFVGQDDLNKSLCLASSLIALSIYLNLEWRFAQVIVGLHILRGTSYRCGLAS